MAYPVVGQSLAPQSIGDRWTAYMSDPTFRAGLLQAGLALMQPIPSGQTFLGHVGTSVGSGLAATGRAATAEQQDVEDELELERKRNADRRADEGLSMDREQLGLSKRRVATEERNARSLEEQRKKSGAPGGVSLNSIFAAQNRLENQKLKWVADRTVGLNGEPDMEIINDPIRMKQLRDAAEVIFGGGQQPSAPNPQAPQGQTTAQPIPEPQQVKSGMSSKATRAPPPGHVEYLKAHAGEPKVMSDFDALYGQGASQRILDQYLKK